MRMKTVRAALAVTACTLAFAASAQITVPVLPPPLVPNGVNQAAPTQNLNGPKGVALQASYPYPGQCLADGRNTALFPLLTTCAVGGGSFASPSRTAGGWAVGVANGANVPFAELNAILPNSVPPAGTPATPKFQYFLLNPMAYTPDTATYPGADYYEIGVHEAWGFQGIATAGTALAIPLFPDPTLNAVQKLPVPQGMQWTGLICNIATGCSCPADASPTFKSQYCSAAGKIPAGAPLFTPIWGVGQINQGGGPVTTALTNAGLFAPGPAVAWSNNTFVATWPSISIRAKKGTPVVVKWTNEFPNNHVFCPHPEAADWPCAIDRTFMGVRARVDPGLASSASVPSDAVNQYGSPQQPDNSWVTHLHGGEIPPSTDGFAEKWFGNPITSAAYVNSFVNPPFENPSMITLKRPTVNSDTYTYPMVQEEATIWFHDHTLGKTHQNVVAGPAGFFPVKEPLKHGQVVNGKCQSGDCSYTWLDPVTEPLGALAIPKFDLFMAVQDRQFNDDGSINFMNGLGQKIPAATNKAPIPLGFTSITNGVNPQVHPTWVPEYFADHVLVNGVLWPKSATAPGWYRMRLVDGADSRCWTVGFSTVFPAPGTVPTNNVPFFVIADDQGYLQRPVLAPANQFTMCPGERYELLVNFGALAAPVSVYMTNSAPAPYPAGITPFAPKSPYAEMNVVMRFDVNAANGAGVSTCGGTAVSNGAYSYPSGFSSGGTCIPDPALYGFDPAFKDIRPAFPFPPGTIVRQVYLNEKVDGVTLSSMGLQLNGVPFEYKVTETPKKGTKEVWQYINTTVDAHPLHPHLVSHQVVSRQPFNVGQYKALLCGSTTCQLGPAPGGEMQVIPDVNQVLLGNGPTLVTAASVEGGRKDATQVLPGQVTTIVADWSPRWAPTTTNSAAVVVPGTAGCPANGTCGPASFLYEDVTRGPYVWHCHINSHEDSEMMRTSLVVQ
jgi:spore coat protein A, manganese oxidase